MQERPLRSIKTKGGDEVSIEKVKEFAKQNGKKNAEYIGDYKDYKVYLLYNFKGECAGYPYYALEKDGELELFKRDKSIEILKAINKGEIKKSA